MSAHKSIASVSVVVLLCSMSLCTPHRSLVFAQNPLDPATRTATELAKQQISSGSESFALDLFQVMNA